MLSNTLPVSILTFLRLLLALLLQPSSRTVAAVIYVQALRFRSNDADHANLASEPQGYTNFPPVSLLGLCGSKEDDNQPYVRKNTDSRLYTSPTRCIILVRYVRRNILYLYSHSHIINH